MYKQWHKNKKHKKIESVLFYIHLFLFLIPLSPFALFLSPLPTPTLFLIVFSWLFSILFLVLFVAKRLYLLY